MNNLKTGLAVLPMAVAESYLRSCCNGSSTTHRFGGQTRHCCFCKLGDSFHHYACCAVARQIVSDALPALVWSIVGGNPIENLLNLRAVSDSEILGTFLVHDAGYSTMLIAKYGSHLQSRDDFVCRLRSKGKQGSPPVRAILKQWRFSMT
mmetsp:Transcript_160089/g.509656  ORF Transcript_160089/g.509656 Transcript_160089/m.509656 type:complete len:150 (-) Transcript_160089:145-594(-)